MKDDDRKRFRSLADEFKLTADDFWSSPQGFVIISRRGIEKIQNGLQAEITYEVVPEFSDMAESKYVVKAIGSCRDRELTTASRFDDSTGKEVLTAYTRVRHIETFGESSPKNTRGGAQSYPVAMAEKRALSRCILKMSDFYTLNVFGEDEITE